MPTITIQPDVEVDFEVFCAGCGAGICNNTDVRTSRTRGMPQLTVEPCKKCLEEARKVGASEKEDELIDEINELKSELKALEVKV